MGRFQQLLMRARAKADAARQWLAAQKARIVTAVLVVMFGLMAAPTLVPQAQSFSVSTSGLLSSAADIFNGLWPVFAVIAGLGLGIALVKFVVSAIRGAFG